MPGRQKQWLAAPPQKRLHLTQRLQCSSFLVLTYFLLRDYNILPEKELHSSLWVDSCSSRPIPAELRTALGLSGAMRGKAPTSQKPGFATKLALATCYGRCYEPPHSYQPETKPHTLSNPDLRFSCLGLVGLLFAFSPQFWAAPTDVVESQDSL